MPDMRMDRLRSTGVLLLLCWTLIGLCGAGPGPRGRGQRTRHARHHEQRWSQGIREPSPHGQRIEYPSMSDEGTQRVVYPWGRGQTVQDPSADDSGAGFQIQKCAAGYFRDRSGFFLGRCVPCDCNGLSEECEDGTGKCLSCQSNTAGDRCERCKEGYFGSAAQKSCRVCPCPFSLPANNFAIGCKEVFGDVECVCRAGYRGDRCESCASGYYGDPLTPGGSCRPCNCYGRGSICDPRTGVCKNTLEPGDTNTDQRCHECDNCARTLLHDLEKLDEELGRIKTQMDNATASATSQERLKKLQKAVSDTKILVNKFSSAVNSQKSKVNQLEDDVGILSDDIGTLKNKADKAASDADKAVADVGKTHDRAEDLDSEIQNMLKKIRALLDQLKEAGTSGDAGPNDNLAKMLQDAQRMVKEMEDRNFTPQKTAAEKERDEAMKLLDHVKGNFTKQCDENEAAAEKLRGNLKGYEAKLKDLDKALKQAADLLKKTNAQNGLNAQALKDLQKRIKDLKQERETVEDQMTMTEKELQKTEDLVKMLSDSKTEYEQLAAQMDGAKTDLTKKVNEIANAAAKKGIVEDAEEHAKNLDKLTRELEKAVKDASARPEVRNAKDAIDAYKNITDAVNAAEAAANEAKDAADSALNNLNKQKLTQRATDLKETSDDLMKNAKEAEKDLQDAAANVIDLKKRLDAAGTKKNALQKDLLGVQDALNNINTGDVRDMIDDAKNRAASANNSATDTMNKLDDIKKEIDKINISPVNSNLNLDDVEKSVKNLMDTIPTLNDKLSEVESLTSQFSTLSNISENIKKMKELIEQARDAANRIVVPMNFLGKSHVEMRAPKNLEDLKAYTSLSLSLQRPEGRGDGRRRRRQAAADGDMFVLYLGNKDSSKNYMGLVLRANVLYAVYKLNGVEYSIESGSISKSAPEPAQFDRVDLQRIYQDVQMNLTKDITSNDVTEPIVKNKKGEESKNLLDISPSDVVFYVGGYPDNFVLPASLNFPKYKGCIEFFSVNDKIVSLYNFEKAENVNEKVPCKRYARPLDSSYYEGTGYGKVVIDKASNLLLVSMSLYSRSENGLLMYIGSKDDYFTVTIEKGFVVIRSNLQAAPAISTTKSFPTTDWADMLIIRTSSGKMTVRLSNKEVVTAQATFDNKEFEELYLGGAPLEMREKHNITILPYKGCLKNMKLNKDFKPITDPVGISKGCPMDSLVTRKAEFSLGSALTYDLKGFSLANDVTVSLGFKSTENQGLILQGQQPGQRIDLTLEKGHVMLHFGKIWKSNEQYNDGHWHYLTITRRGERVSVIIDDEDTGRELGDSNAAATTGDAFALGKNTFRGCISNLYTRRSDNLYRPEDFSNFHTAGNVLLDVCTADTLPQLMLDRASRKR